MKYTAYAGTYFGIPVRIHFTFPLILVIFGIRAAMTGGLGEALWTVLFVLIVFVCVVLHEFGHSLQIMRYGIPVRDIVLLPIGGMARAERIPENPWQEIVVAISGPLVNFVLATIFFAILYFTGSSFDPDVSLVASLFWINIVLGVFNLVPAFPMDGGRILRGLLATRLPYLRATRYARAVGQLIALGFVVLGFISSSFIMLPVIAVFIFFGAMSEETMIRVRLTLEGKQLGEFVRAGQVGFDPETTVEEAFTTANAYRAPAYAVVSGATGAVGVVSFQALSDAIRAGAGSTAVGEHANPVAMLQASMPAIKAYYLMKAEKQLHVGVADHDAFIGLVFAGDFLSREP